MWGMPGPTGYVSNTGSGYHLCRWRTKGSCTSRGVGARESRSQVLIEVKCSLYFLASQGPPSNLWAPVEFCWNPDALLVLLFTLNVINIQLKLESPASRLIIFLGNNVQKECHKCGLGLNSVTQVIGKASPVWPLGGNQTHVMQYKPISYSYVIIQQCFTLLNLL